MSEKPRKEDSRNNSPIHFVAGGKGGVGKSLFSMALLDYIETKLEESPIVFESDTSNPDVAKAYHNSKVEGIKIEAHSLDMLEGWEELATIANDNPKSSIVVNTGARNSDGITKFGDLLLQAVKELKRPLHTWWVINGEIDSIGLLKRYLKVMPGHPVHIVLNQRDENTSFRPWESDDEDTKNLREEIKKLGGKEVKVPMLGAHIAQELRNNRLTLRGIYKAAPFGKKMSIDGWRSKVADAVAGALASPARAA